MRLEATIPDARAEAVLALAEQLGLSRSQLIDEALALFIKAVLEVRRGRRLVTQDIHNEQMRCELTTPTLTTLEWALALQHIALPDEALDKIQQLIDAQPTPSATLRAAAKRHGG